MDTMGVDAPPSADMPRRGGFLGFLGTIPGILTATAGVLSAAGGIYYAAHDQGATSPGGGTYNITVQGASVPSGSAEVDTGSLSSRMGASGYDGMSAVVDDCANGDADACTVLLDRLAQDCYDGYGTSCDVLYEISASGSDYEAYGATCGGRYDWTYADACSQL